MIKLKEFPLYPEAELRMPCDKVANREEAQKLKKELSEQFPEAGALAVACPQIGIHKQAFLAKMPNDKQWLFACNLEIYDREEQFLFRDESCLSFPGQQMDTLRFNRVYVKYRDENFEERRVIAEKLEAVIFQHEVDHLNGILYKDRVIKPHISSKKIGRNEPCPCSSGKKYKKCCGG